MPKQKDRDYSDKSELETFDYRVALENEGYAAVTEILPTLQDAFAAMRLHVRNGTPGFIDESKTAPGQFQGYLGKVPGRAARTYHRINKVLLRW